jgi:hypothetical protein
MNDPLNQIWDQYSHRLKAFIRSRVEDDIVADDLLQETFIRVRTGQALQLIAVINNVVLGIFARLGYTSAPEACRHFAAHLDEATHLVLRALC